MLGLHEIRPSQQLLSLRTFQLCGGTRYTSHTAVPSRHVAAAAATPNAGGVQVLQGAQRLQLPGLAVPAAQPVGGFPPCQEWGQHPELLQGCEPSSAPLQVAVLLSGGVDSSLALHLLHAAGHSVTAYYLQIWFQEDFRNTWDSCPWEEDVEYCRAVCDRLGVPLKMVPLSTQYWDRVVTHSIAEIRAGRTPNPDILCNSRVKFGAFLEHLEQVEAAGGPRYDRIASGHYASVQRVTVPDDTSISGGAVVARLALSPDQVKDQTYFLAHLKQRQLARVSFPLGSLTKVQVRALAAAAALPNQARKDSQGICFLGKVRFDEFVKEHLGEWPGPFIEDESGEVVGYHRGFWFHTIGQRKGIHLSGGPWYVTRKDPQTNVVFVSRQYFDAAAAERRSAFTCTGFAWTADLRPDPALPLHCKVRHGPHLYGCTLQFAGELDDDGAVGSVQLDGVDQGLAAGQYVVFYQENCCLGCAMIVGEGHNG